MSATSVQFTVAAHIMAALAFHPGKEIHSAVLAESVNTHPSFVRKSLSKLSKAGLVSTSRGKNGASKLARSAKTITVLDIYRASSAPAAFAVHRYPEKRICPISVGIKGCMNSILAQAQGSFEKALARITLADVVRQLKK
jgi:Rrf2 family protein